MNLFLFLSGDWNGAVTKHWTLFPRSRRFIPPLHCLLQHALKVRNNRKVPFYLFILVLFFTSVRTFWSATLHHVHRQRREPPWSKRICSCELRQNERKGGGAEIPIRHFSKECIGFFLLPSPPLLFHSCSFLIYFSTSYTSVYPPPFTPSPPPPASTPSYYFPFPPPDVCNCSRLLWPFKMHFLIPHKKPESAGRLQASSIQHWGRDRRLTTPWSIAPG
jgi:hypothetical protein